MPTTKTKKIKIPQIAKSYNVVKFEDEAEWLKFREGRITGSKKVIAKRGGFLKDYWQLIADKVALTAEPEDDRERGKRLESQAIEVFEKQTGKKVNRELVMWISTENENLAISPDGTISDTEAVEMKAPDNANYIETLYSQEIPDTYYYQKLHYFVVNQELQTLYFGFYNPLIIAKPFFYITVKRIDHAEEIENLRKEYLQILQNVDKIVAELSGF